MSRPLPLTTRPRGGLLIRVDADQGDELVERLRSTGAREAYQVGTVTARQTAALILRV